MNLHKKRKLIFAGFFSLLLWSCKKDAYNCGYSYHYIPGRAAFIGFSTSELSLIIVNRYIPNNNFDSLMTTDTLDGSSGIVKGDTTYYKANEYFFEVASGADFKVWVPNAGKEYRITEVRSFETGSEWTQEEPCARGALQAQFRGFAFKLNGQDYPDYNGAVGWHIFLSK